MGGRIRRVKTASRELQHGDNLLSRNVEPFHDLVHVRSSFEVFKYRGHRHPGVLKHPCAAQSARHAFHGGALRPIESCHLGSLLPSYPFSTAVTPSMISASL